jgi:hypothetical protein
MAINCAEDVLNAIAYRELPNFASRTQVNAIQEVVSQKNTTALHACPLVQ